MPHRDEVDKLIPLVLDQVIQLLKVSVPPCGLLADLLELGQLHVLDAHALLHVFHLQGSRVQGLGFGARSARVLHLRGGFRV